MRKLTPCAYSCLQLVLKLVPCFQLQNTRPLISNDQHALCYSSFSNKAQMKWPNIRKGAFIRLTLSGRGIHRITVQMTCYFNLRKKWKCIRDLKIRRFRVWVWIEYVQNTLPRRMSQATGCNNDLIARGGTPDLKSAEKNGKNQNGFQQHLNESLDQKFTLKISLLNCSVARIDYGKREFLRQ